MRGVVLTWVLGSLLAGSAPRADTPARTLADEMFDEGRRHLHDKDYARACAAFEQSFAAEPAIGTQLNIALCYDRWGRLAIAYRAYVAAERMARAAADDRADHARMQIDRLAKRVAHLRILAAATEGTIYLIDGTELTALTEELIVDPGAHAIEVRVPGAPAKTIRVQLEAGEHQELRIESPAPPPPPPPPGRDKLRLYGGLALLAGSLSAFGIGGFVVLDARADYNAAVAMCPDRMCDSAEAFDATNAARDRANAMTYVFVGGGVAALAGVYLLLTSRIEPAESRVSARPLVTGHVVGLAIGGSL